MTPPACALFFTCLFVGNMAHGTPLEELFHFESADVGESVTLQCRCQNVAVMIYWYKQLLGKKPELLFTFYKNIKKGIFENEFNNTRFSLDTGSHTNHLLKISDLRISDSGTYHCVTRNIHNFKFCGSTIVSVKGSDLSIQTLVQQPGGSVTLNCTVHTGTCDGGHSVYWFKNSDESHPGIIYTHGDRNKQCERKPNTQTHTCMYNLPKNSLKQSQAGTYYCAVASCGHILFGNGTKLDSEGASRSADEQEPFALVYFLSGALAFTTILVVSLAVSLFKMSKSHCRCTDSSVAFSAASTPNTVLHQDGGNLHYAAVRVYKANRSRRKTDDTSSECVYSSVRQ